MTWDVCCCIGVRVSVLVVVTGAVVLAPHTIVCVTAGGSVSNLPPSPSCL